MAARDGTVVHSAAMSKHRPTETAVAIASAPACGLKVIQQSRRAPTPDCDVLLSAVWFDYTDLLQYFTSNRLPTGIQRVQIELHRAALARSQVMGRPLGCAFLPPRGGWVAVPEMLFAQLCAASCDGSPDALWTQMVAAMVNALAQAPMAAFAPGDVLVNIGSSWWIPDYMTHVRYMQRERGLLYAPFVHDCIPILVPEMCAVGLVEEFRGWFPQMARAADIILANSACTARDIATVSRATAKREVSAHVVRLDARFADPLARLPEAATNRLRASVHGRLGLARPFALFVSTVEARKNHIFVFECWAALIAEHGDAAIPDLVCVGKQGWLVEYTLNWLAVHPELKHRIRMVGTLPDNDLAVLYSSALFTVYCSHYEGWGLPVTESLSHGRVPLVANHSSLPEAGGDLALYFEPGSRSQFCAQVARLLDPAERAELEAAIATGFRPRGWPEVLEQLLSTVREAPLLDGDEGAAPPLVAGRVYGFGQSAGAVDLLEDGAVLRHGPGWSTAEPWGAWSNQPVARLFFRPEWEDDASHFVFVAVRGGPEGVMLKVDVGGLAPKIVELRVNQRRLLRIELAHAAAELMITFSSAIYPLSTYTGGGDPRTIGFGLESVAFVAESDFGGRATVSELFHAGG